jgi:hypothetical protein
MSLPFLHHVSTTAACFATNVEKSAIHHKYFLRIYQITWRHIQKVKVTALRTSSLDFQKGYNLGVQIMGNSSPGRTNFTGAAPNTCCGSRSVALASRHRSGVLNFEPQPGFLKSSCTPRYVSNSSDARTANQKKANHFCILRY